MAVSRTNTLAQTLNFFLTTHLGFQVATCQYREEIEGKTYSDNAPKPLHPTTHPDNLLFLLFLPASSSYPPPPPPLSPQSSPFLPSSSQYSLQTPFHIANNSHVPLFRAKKLVNSTCSLPHFGRSERKRRKRKKSRKRKKKRIFDSNLVNLGIILIFD